MWTVLHFVYLRDFGRMDTPMISAIVCALNEEKTIKTVLNAIQNTEEIGEIIVVSDGSTDTTAQIARSYPITVIEHKKPWGKAQSMEDAVRKAHGDSLLFLDADLYRITSTHVKKIIARFKRSGGMVVGLRDRGHIMNFLAHFFPLISGQRILEREIFEKTPSRYKKGYKIEVALNATARHLDKPIVTLRLQGVTVRTKLHKTNLYKAIYQYIFMAWHVTSALLLTPITLWLTKTSKTKK